MKKRSSWRLPEETDIDDSTENENDLFALTEHARMAAAAVREQHPAAIEQTDAPVH